MAQLQEAITIDAPPAGVFALVRDQSQRERFLPDGWRFQRCLTEVHDEPGATMALEATIGPAPTLEVVQLQYLRLDEPPGQSQLVESPPAADNYITTWTVRARNGGSLVILHTEFSYGDMLAEFFVRRRLRKAYAQMLRRLKTVAELDARHHAG